MTSFAEHDIPFLGKREIEPQTQRIYQGVECDHHPYKRLIVEIRGETMINGRRCDRCQRQQHKHHQRAAEADGVQQRVPRHDLNDFGVRLGDHQIVQFLQVQVQQCDTQHNIDEDEESAHRDAVHDGQCSYTNPRNGQHGRARHQAPHQEQHTHGARRVCHGRATKCEIQATDEQQVQEHSAQKIGDPNAVRSPFDFLDAVENHKEDGVKRDKYAYQAKEETAYCSSVAEK